jgi:hypothetical protein
MDKFPLRPLDDRWQRTVPNGEVEGLIRLICLRLDGSFDKRRLDDGIEKLRHLDPSVPLIVGGACRFRHSNSRPVLFFSTIHSRTLALDMASMYLGNMFLFYVKDGIEEIGPGQQSYSLYKDAKSDYQNGLTGWRQAPFQHIIGG